MIKVCECNVCECDLMGAGICAASTHECSSPPQLSRRVACCLRPLCSGRHFLRTSEGILELLFPLSF